MSTPTPGIPAIPATPSPDSPEPAVYVRHRDRMVRESVFEDLRNTLIACRWITGTTTTPVHRVEDGVKAVVTTAPEQVLRLVNTPINLIEYFPETQGQQVGAVPMNTFALDVGRDGDSSPMELGSTLTVSEKVFNMAFYAEEDATAMALFNDLKDRYRGALVAPDAVSLYNYLADPPALISRMEVDLFRYARDSERVAPEEVHLYFAELTLSDVAL